MNIKLKMTEPQFHALATTVRAVLDLPYSTRMDLLGLGNPEEKVLLNLRKTIGSTEGVIHYANRNGVS